MWHVKPVPAMQIIQVLYAREGTMMSGEAAIFPEDSQRHSVLQAVLQYKC